MRFWREILIVILIFIIVGMWFVNHERNNELTLGNEKLRSDIKSLQSKIADSKAITDTLKKEVAILKQKHIVKEAKADKPIRKLKQRIEEARPEVMIEIDSMAVVKAFVGDLDSLNLAQENKIEVLKVNHLEDLALRESIISQQDTTIVKQDSVIFVQNSLIEDQDKAIKRDKRREKVLKVLIPVAIVFGLLIGI
jgi:hypothetical protein